MSINQHIQVSETKYGSATVEIQHIYRAAISFDIEQFLNVAALNDAEVGEVFAPDEGINSLDLNSQMTNDGANSIDMRGTGTSKFAGSTGIIGETITDEGLNDLDVATSIDNRNQSSNAIRVYGQTRKPMRNAIVVRGRSLDYVGTLSLEISNHRIYLCANTTELIGGLVETSQMAQVAEISSGDSFMILAGILDLAIAEATGSGNVAGVFNSVQIYPKLLVDDNEVYLTEFSYDEPKGRLGALLNVTLAQKITDGIPKNASIKFSLVVVTQSGEAEVVLMDNGKLAGRTYEISYQGGRGLSDGPTDSITFGALDVISDKFTLAPRRPVVMFDPDKITYRDVEVRASDAILDENGIPIRPIIEPVSGMMMSHVLKRAYTDIGGYELMTPLTPAQRTAMLRALTLLGTPDYDQRGIGFSNVITNIKDYRVSRADFTIEAGWHDGARPLVNMYGPLYFVLNDILYIIDREKALPYGVSVRDITVNDYKRLAQDSPYNPNVNAILLTYQIPASEDENTGWAERTVLNQTIDSSEELNYGDVGYTETRTIEYVTERYDIFNTSNVIAEFVNQVVVETRIDYGSGLVLVHRETQQNRYEDDLKVGHDKRVEGLQLVGTDRSTQLVELLRELNYTYWADDPAFPGEKVQKRSYTRVDGVVYQSVESETRLNPVTGEEEEYYTVYPFIAAQANGIVDSDGLVFYSTIETTTETLRKTKGNQYDVSIVTVDYLNKTVKRSITSPRTGSTSTSPFEVRSKTMLIRDTDSEDEIGPRIPYDVNAGGLPEDRAKELGHSELERLKNPLFPIQVQLPGVDFTVVRGAIVGPKIRDGSQLGKYITVGRSIRGSNLFRRGHRVNMSLELEELPS